MSEWFRERKDPMSRIFEELERMMNEAISEELAREHELPEGGMIREFGPFTYGYSIRIGPDGKPEIQEFGNIRPSRRPQPPIPFKPQPPIGREIPNEKEPIIDVFNKNKEVKVIAELPGVEESNIALRCTGRSLIISVNNEKWREIDLPVEVDSKSNKVTYKNGILEVTLNKIATEKKEDGESKIRWL